ncbi:ATP-binding protein [bacterium]|nr:ATP-binding protein [bacterium]
MNTIMNTHVATTEQVGSDIIKIKVLEHIDPNKAVDDLYVLFAKIFKAGYNQIVFDMEYVQFPNGSFIAMLISCTHKARRFGGDVQIVHLSEMARNHLAIFTPLTYLTIGMDVVSPFNIVSEFHTPTLAEYEDFEKGISKFIDVDATVDSLNVITHFVTVLAQKAGLKQVELSKLKIAVYEVCMNIVEHGYAFEPDHSISVEVMWEDHRLQITITDHGEVFDFYNERPYDVEEAFQEKRAGGFGLYIIKRSVDEVKYKSDPEKGNRLTLIKNL